MYDCEGVVTNDPKMNEIYYKYVQEQMIRALDNATEYLAISDALNPESHCCPTRSRHLKTAWMTFSRRALTEVRSTTP